MANALHISITFLLGLSTLPQCRRKCRVRRVRFLRGKTVQPRLPPSALRLDNSFFPSLGTDPEVRVSHNKWKTKKSSKQVKKLETIEGRVGWGWLNGSLYPWVMTLTTPFDSATPSAYCHPLIIYCSRLVPRFASAVTLHYTPFE